MWLNGRASVCGTEGCRFKSYYPPLVRITFFKRNKIQRKLFKKKTDLIGVFKQVYLILKKNTIFFKKFKNLNFYESYFFRIKANNVISAKTDIAERTMVINLGQKKHTLKSTVFRSTTLNTFTVGSVMKYFKIAKGKYIRRSTKGFKVFLNFLKTVISKKYFNIKPKISYLVLNVRGVNHSIISSRAIIKGLLSSDSSVRMYSIINPTISFTKTKNKKVKSIKKRLKKKLILKSF